MFFGGTVMMKRVFIGAIMATVVLGGVASASLVTVTTATGSGADGGIQNDMSKGPTTLGGTSTAPEIRSYDTGTGTYRTKLGILRFDLTSLSGGASGATLTMQFKNNTTVVASGGVTLSVYAMTDDTLDGWAESTLCFNTAPAVSGALNSYVLDPTKTTLLGTIFNATEPTTAFTSSTTALAMDSYINTELATGNKMLTLYLVMTPTGNNSNDLYIFNKEIGGTTYTFPTLSFDNVPEPMTLAILGLGGLIIRRKVA
jgi:hypothetical protein